MKKRFLTFLLAVVMCVSSFPLSVLAAVTTAATTEGGIVVDRIQAYAGSTVTVNVNVTDNPGIAGARIYVRYDAKLTLTNAKVGDTFAALDYTAPPVLDSGCAFNWDSLDQEITQDGTLLSLTFDVSDSALAEEKLEVEISYTYGDIYNKDLDSLSFDVTNGYVQIIDYIPGDVNGDQTVNGKDVTLIRRLNAGFEVALNKLAADVNADGTINGKDVTLIRRYNAGFDVELLPSQKNCEHVEVIDVAVQPTCTTSGWTAGSHCSLCHEVIVEKTAIPALGHTYIWIVDKDATETQTGIKHESCYSCGDVRNPNTVIPLAPHAHSMEYTAAVAATCTRGGSIAYWTCTDCGKMYDSAIADHEIQEKDIPIKAKGHNECVVDAVGATCVISGTTESSYCRDCGITLKYAQVIPALGHVYKNGVCTRCGGEEDKPLEVQSVYVDKTLLMAGEQVTFRAETNKNNESVTISAVIYRDGAQVARVSDVGSLTYTPSEAGRYHAEVSVTDDGVNIFSFYLKSCFDVKPFWSVKQITPSADKVSFGEILSFSAEIEGETSDLDYTITVYKDNESYYFIEGKDSIDFYPNVAGTYCAEIVAIDSYGESRTVRSSNVVVEAKTIVNPILNVNYGTTLNIDELVGKTGYEVIVPSGKNITLTWDKRDSDSYYRINISAANQEMNAYNESVKDYTQNSYTVSSSNLIPGYEYVAKLRRYDAAGNIIDNRVYTFHFTVSGAESILLEKEFEIISPIQDGVYAYDDITIQWTKLNFASKYVLFFTYSCGVNTHSIYDGIEISATQNTYKIPKSDLHQGCGHSVTIYAYDSLGNEVKKKNQFKIEGDESTYQLFKPEFTGNVLYDDWDDVRTHPVYEDIEITWTEVPAAAYYIISVSSVYSEVKDPVIVGSDHVVGNSLIIPVAQLMGGCEYRVSVSACCADGHSKRGVAKKYFRAPYENGTVLDPPVITSHDLSTDPNNPTVIVEQELTLTWESVSAASTYSICWERLKNDEYKFEYELKKFSTNSVKIPKEYVYVDNHSKPMDFRLTIKAQDSNGMMVDCYYYVRVVESSIEEPVLLSPNLATSGKDNLPSFNDDFTVTWTAVPDAVSYRVRIWEYSDDEYDVIFEQEGIGDTSYTVPIDELYEGGKFRIAVTAIDQYGNGNADVGYFTVGRPGIVVLSKDAWSSSYEADYEYLHVQTAGDWSAQVSDSWITITPTSGSGTMQVKIKTTENSGDFARFGTVTFTNSDGGVAIFSITQAGNGSSNTGIVQITSPNQGDTIEADALKVKWTCKYGWHYFVLTLRDLTDNKVVYTEDPIIVQYAHIPEDYFESGHTYQLTVAQYYNYAKGSEASISFRVDSNIGPDYDPDDEDDTKDDDEQEVIPPTSNSLSYVSNGNGTCYVSGIGSYKGTSLVIPSISPSGERVVGIGASAFAGNTSITSVKISENVTSIGKEAFVSCTGLRSVELPNSLTSIGNAAFWGCTSLTNVAVPVGVTLIDYAAFSHCSALTTIQLQSSLKTIGEYAFYQCVQLKSIYFDGTKSQWDALNKASSWAEGCGNFQVICAIDDGGSTSNLAAPVFTSHAHLDSVSADKALTVSWKSVSGASKYTYVVYRLDGSNKETVASGTGATCTLTVRETQLQAGYYYEIRVQAISSSDGYGNSAWATLCVRAVEDFKTYNQIQTEKFIQQLSSANYLTTQKDSFIYEYYIAHQNHLRENEGYDIGDMARHTFLGGDIIGNTWKWMWDREGYEKENMIYPFLYTVIGNMPELSENEKAMKDMKFPSQTAAVWENVDAFASFADSIHDPIEAIGDAAKGAEPILKIADSIDIDQDLLTVVGFINDYLQYQKFALAAELEYFDVLLESIDDTSENRVLIDAIKQMKIEYENQYVAAFNNTCNYLKNEFMDEVLMGGVEAGLAVAGVAFAGEIILVVEAADFIISTISAITGGKDYVEALDNVAYYGFLPQMMKIALIERINEYDGSVESADMIVAHYNLWRSMQLFFNEQTEKICDASDKRQLKKENEHIKSATMMNWSFNPYNTVIQKPADPDWTNYYYDILLKGDAYKPITTDGVLENWNKYSVYDKILVGALLKNLESFAKSPIQSAYIIKGTRYDTDISFGDAILEGLNALPSIGLTRLLMDLFYVELDKGIGYYRILFVNEAGEGLVFFRGYENEVVVETFYAVMTPQQTKMMICGSFSPEHWFTMDNNGAHSIRTKPEGYMSVTDDYIRFDIDVAQYHRILNRITCSTYCDKSTDKIDLLNVIDEDIYPDIDLFWIVDTSLKNISNRIIKENKQAYYWDNDDGISPELLNPDIPDTPVTPPNNNLYIAGVDIGYEPGDYFSTTGEECVCHDRNTCGNAADCTCKGVSSAWQCKGFALWCQEKLYGCNEKSVPANFKYLDNASVPAGQLTAEKLKDIISRAPIGAHIRTNAPEHSMVLISKSENGFVVAQANGSNNREYSKYGHCRIGTAEYTWENYFTRTSQYGLRGIDYISYYTEKAETSEDWTLAYNPNRDASITPELIERFLDSYPNGRIADDYCKIIDGETYLVIDGTQYSLGFSNYYLHTNTVATSNPLKKYETAKELTPAEIIYYACVENDINVVWVLANIQKEQSLIGQNYSNHQTRLNRATGYMNVTSSGRRHYLEGEKHCGFIGQVIGCSYQFKKYAGDGKGMEEAYYTYTPASESGNMPYDTFMSTIYTPYSDWFDRAMGR